jgi:RimK family alpha-L-glutamate ligase
MVEIEEVDVRVVVIGSRSNAASTVLAERWAAIGIEAELMTAGAAPELLRRGDVALGRLDVLPSLDGVEAGLFDLLRLERRGIKVLNPAAALLAAHDKLRTARLLRAARVPHPVTLRARRLNEVRLQPPLVLKPRFGSWGADVALCLTEAAVRDRLAEIRDRGWFLRHGVLVQEAVPSEGHDLRVLIAAGRVIGAIARTAAPGEWRTNVSCGAGCEPVRVSAAAAELAATAAAAIDADLVGVDLMPLGDDRYVVLELNGAVDFGDDYVLGDADVYADAAAALRVTGGIRRTAALQTIGTRPGRRRLMITQRQIPRVLVDTLEEAAIAYELLPHAPTSSAVDEARALGVAPEQVGKTLVIGTRSGLVRAVIPASERLDLEKVRSVLGEDSAELLSEEALAEAFPEYELGAVPPLGGVHNDSVVVDIGVCEHGSVVIEAGTHSQSIRIAVGDLVGLENARIADICLD